MRQVVPGAVSAANFVVEAEGEEGEFGRLGMKVGIVVENAMSSSETGIETNAAESGNETANEIANETEIATVTEIETATGTGGTREISGLAGHLRPAEAEPLRENSAIAIVMVPPQMLTGLVAGHGMAAPRLLARPAPILPLECRHSDEVAALLEVVVEAVERTGRRTEAMAARHSTIAVIATLEAGLRRAAGVEIVTIVIGVIDIHLKGTHGATHAMTATQYAPRRMAGPRYPRRPLLRPGMFLRRRLPPLLQLSGRSRVATSAVTMRVQVLGKYRRPPRAHFSSGQARLATWDQATFPPHAALAPRPEQEVMIVQPYH